MRRFVRLKQMAPSRKAHSTSSTSPAITVRDNRWLKRFRAALGGDRADGDPVGVEGVRLVEAALGSRLRVEALLVSDSGERHLARVASLLENGAQILRTSDRLFAGVTDTQSPQGIAALVEPRKTTIETLLCGSELIVVLAGVQDPGNVGTILRAAEALGATGAAACALGSIGTADPLGPKALRASAGSALRLPFVQGIPLAGLISKFRNARVKIYAAVAAQQPRDTERRGESLILRPWEADWKSQVALLIGNEGAGLPEDVARSADARICIPLAASSTPIGVESLNAAMAATVLLYEAMRQRRALDESGAGSTCSS
ncbi:MAG: TrmH family RNA methyltransferase [Candidatus Acidiferrales bacterium]